MKKILIIGFIIFISILLSGCTNSQVSVDTNQGQVSNDATVGRITPNAEIINGKIFLIGGMDIKGNSLNLVEEYDPVNRTWTIRSPMPTKRVGADSVVFNNEIYVIGGRSENSVLSVVEKYNPATDKWTSLSGMPTARWNLMTEESGGKIYAFGGVSGTGNNRRDLSTVEVYSVNENTWKPISSMPFKRQNGASATLNDQIFIISGRSGTGDTGSVSPRVDRFNPTTGEWTSIRDLPVGRTGLRAAVSNGKIVVSGGASQELLNPDILVYSPSTLQWTSVSQMSIPRTGHVSVAIGDTVYILSGSDKMDPPSVTNLVESVVIK
jgi:N-acetylneuraminic acid mutarotase